MTHGLVTSVEARPLGSELVAPAAIGASTLFVDMVADFSEDGGSLILNGVTMGYTTVDPDLETVTLATTLAAAAEESDFVAAVEAGKAAVEWTADVALDEGDTVTAVIPTTLISYFPEGTYDDEVTAEIALVGDRYQVTSQPERDPAFDGAVVWNPYVIQSMNSLTVPDSTFTQVTSWTVTEAVAVDTGSGLTITYPGVYYIAVQNTWATNSSGRRYARILVNGSQTAYFNAAAETSGVTYVAVFALARLAEGDVVTIELQQTSGASLAIGVGVGISQMAMYRVSI